MNEQYTPPAGWRVKGDDEVVKKGDAYSHAAQGYMRNEPNTSVDLAIGFRVSAARKEYMPRGGYILTPIVEPATPQPDVSRESQCCNKCGTNQAFDFCDCGQEQQTDDRSPLDIYLPEVERKINLAAKDRPDLLDWWRGVKEALAIEADCQEGGPR